MPNGGCTVQLYNASSYTKVKKIHKNAEYIKIRVLERPALSGFAVQDRVLISRLTLVPIKV
jgi:hypothetical protein